MNILIFTWRDIKNPASGGAEVVTHELSKKWVAWCHKVTVFTTEFPKCKRLEFIDGVKYIRRGGIFTQKFFAIFYYFKHFRDKFDLIIDQFHVFPFFTPFFVKEKKAALIFETTENIWWYQILFPFSLLGWLVEPLVFIFYKSIPFLTISYSTKRDLVRMGITPENIFVFKVGITNVPLRKLPIKEGQPTLISVGRITPMKRIEDAIRAFEIVQKKFSKSKLWIVGDGERGYIKKLNSISCELGIENKITFWGKISDKQKVDLLSRSWCLVSTSVKEGWGLVAIEANSCGTPIVSYKAGALKEAVRNGKTGILIGKETPKNLAREVIRVFSNSSLRSKLSKNALLHSRSFNWGESAKIVLGKLKEV